jgi:hypothetical protein
MLTFILSASLFCVATLIYAYYTVWVFVTPFLSTDNFFQKYFIDRSWAYIIPGSVLIAVFIAMLNLIVYYTYIIPNRKKKAAVQSIKEHEKHN